MLVRDRQHGRQELAARDMWLGGPAHMAHFPDRQLLDAVLAVQRLAAAGDGPVDGDSIAADDALLVLTLVTVRAGSCVFSRRGLCRVLKLSGQHKVALPFDELHVPFLHM